MLQQLHARERLGHEHGRLQALLQRDRPCFGHLVQQALRAHDAQHLVQPAAADRIARMAVLAHHRQRLLHRLGGIQPRDITTRDHHRADLPVIQPEHVAHHLVLMLLDHAGVHAFFQAGGDLFFGHRSLGVLADAQHAQDALGADRQQSHERPRQAGQPVHRRRDDTGHGLGIHLAQPLGHQLTEDDGDVGDDHHHQRRARDAGHALADHRQLLVQPGGQRLGERGLADDAVEHADGGDADLHRGEELRRVVVQLHGLACPGVPAFHQHLQPRLAAGGQRHFRHGEQAVEDDEEREKGDFHRGPRAPGPGR